MPNITDRRHCPGFLKTLFPVKPRSRISTFVCVAPLKLQPRTLEDFQDKPAGIPNRGIGDAWPEQKSMQASANRSSRRRRRAGSVDGGGGGGGGSSSTVVVTAALVVVRSSRLVVVIIVVARLTSACQIFVT